MLLYVCELEFYYFLKQSSDCTWGPIRVGEPQREVEILRVIYELEILCVCTIYLTQENL